MSNYKFERRVYDRGVRTTTRALRFASINVRSSVRSLARPDVRTNYVLLRGLNIRNDRAQKRTKSRNDDP